MPPAEIVQPKDNFWESCFILCIVDFYHLTKGYQKQSYVTRNDWVEGNVDKNEGFVIVYPLLFCLCYIELQEFLSV